ncbi:hypothetical protein C8J57DRAFT_1225799 [Mycena rebaudengoi]|nr:hypothetical protein C8J57DRAFT_1225799 [Mycena rebaudengoi]
MTGVTKDVNEKQTRSRTKTDAKTLEPVDPDPAATPPRPPALSWRTRILYLLLMVAVIWLVLQKTGPWFKFRPVASPITTKTLKDGWRRVRGAAPTTSKPPLPKPTKSKTKREKTRSG